jgi:hypothetical protein
MPGKGVYSSRRGRPGLRNRSREAQSGEYALKNLEKRLTDVRIQFYFLGNVGGTAHLPASLD